MTIVHTSGSAGVPKAVLHTCGNHYYNALGSNVNLPPTAEDRWLLDLPHRSGSLSPAGSGSAGGDAAGPARRMTGAATRGIQRGGHT